jgi:pyrimidine-nucleoside phosphorylase
VLEDTSLLAKAPNETVHLASRSGVLARCDALDLGIAALRLGAGREKKEDTIDPGVGIMVPVGIGDTITEGQPLAVLRWADQALLGEAMGLVERAFQIGQEPVAAPPLIYGEVR